jgi:hypothetical protein
LLFSRRSLPPLVSRTFCENSLSIDIFHLGDMILRLARGNQELLLSVDVARFGMNESFNTD